MVLSLLYCTVLYILYCTYYTVGTEGDHIRSRRQPSVVHTQHKRTAASSPPQGYVASLCALLHPIAHLTPISHIIRQLPRIQSNQNRCETDNQAGRHDISSHNGIAAQYNTVSLPPPPNPIYTAEERTPRQDMEIILPPLTRRCVTLLSHLSLPLTLSFPSLYCFTVLHSTILEIGTSLTPIPNLHAAPPPESPPALP